MVRWPRAGSSGEKVLPRRVERARDYRHQRQYAPARPGSSPPTPARRAARRAHESRRQAVRSERARDSPIASSGATSCSITSAGAEPQRHHQQGPQHGEHHHAEHHAAYGGTPAPAIAPKRARGRAGEHQRCCRSPLRRAPRAAGRAGGRGRPVAGCQHAGAGRSKSWPTQAPCGRARAPRACGASATGRVTGAAAQPRSTVPSAASDHEEDQRLQRHTSGARMKTASRRRASRGRGWTPVARGGRRSMRRRAGCRSSASVRAGRASGEASARQGGTAAYTSRRRMSRLLVRVPDQHHPPGTAAVAGSPRDIRSRGGGAQHGRPGCRLSLGEGRSAW